MKLRIEAIKDGNIPENYIVLCQSRIDYAFKRTSHKEERIYYIPFYIFILTRHKKDYIIYASENYEGSYNWALKVVERYNKANNKILPKFLKYYCKF